MLALQLLLLAPIIPAGKELTALELVAIYSDAITQINKKIHTGSASCVLAILNLVGQKKIMLVLSWRSLHDEEK